MSIYDDEIINNVPRKSITSCFRKRSSKVHSYFVKKSKYFQKRPCKKRPYQKILETNWQENTDNFAFPVNQFDAQSLLRSV